MKTEFIILAILCISYILTAVVIRIAVFMLDIKERRRPTFQVSKEVDYMMSRGVVTIERSNPNK